MAQIDDAGKKLTVKLVYYGPALSGKTTNLLKLHDLLDPQLKGEMMILDTKNDRTLFFDMLPVGFRAPSGLLIKLKLFTVPGQVAHDSTRKAVLSRADGVVFVADSQKNQSVNNGQSFENLAENTARLGIEFERLPLVVQFNKRDLPNILSEQEILERWHATPWHINFSNAMQGVGVRETFLHLTQNLYSNLDHNFSLSTEHGLNAELFTAGIAGKVIANNPHAHGNIE